MRRRCSPRNPLCKSPVCFFNHSVVELKVAQGPNTLPIESDPQQTAFGSIIFREPVQCLADLSRERTKICPEYRDEC